MDRTFHEARRVTVAFTLLTTAAVFALVPFSKVRLAFADLDRLALLLAVFAALAAYCWKRGMPRLAAPLEAAALGIFLAVPILVSTYLAASLAAPMADTPLAHADAALGFDWRAFIGYVDASPALAGTLRLAYASFAYQLLALPVLLGLAGQPARGYAMILAFAALCYASSIVSVWFPALGTYAVHGITQADLRHIDVTYGFQFLDDFRAVRTRPSFVVALGSAEGIVTFPSVHAACAVLYSWAAWSVRPLRYPVAAWNGLMAVSAVSHGSHYVVDILAGGVVAAASILLVAGVLAWRPRAEREPSPPALAHPCVPDGNPL